MSDRIEARIELLAQEIADRMAELDLLRAELETLKSNRPVPGINRHSSPQEKIALYRSLFNGRPDAYALRWTSRKTGKSGWSPAVRGGFYTDATTDEDLLPLDDAVLERHLTGGFHDGRELHVGLYPMLADDTCQLLACDFDGGTWRRDASAYAAECADLDVPVAVEISRSGDGAHAWVFFSEPVPAHLARRLGAVVLQAAMSNSASIDLRSYDRLFPAQDLLPRNSPGRMRLGNLIALPLQGDCRRQGTTVFADPSTWEPYEDQFAFLASQKLLSPAELQQILALSTVATVGPGGGKAEASAAPLGPFNTSLELRSAEGIEVPVTGLPASVVSQLKHLASVPNPEFYRKQAQRFSTFGTPRHVICFELDGEVLRLPRGLLDQAKHVLQRSGVAVSEALDLPDVASVNVGFMGELRPDQRAAVADVAVHRTGVLVAPPGAGKTVMACALIASRGVPTAIVVNRSELVNQWRERLTQFLDITDKQIGQLGNGRRKRKGLVDIIMLQSVSHRSADPTVLSEYGQVIIDECHSVAAPAAEAALKQVAARYWLGLTATPYRADQLDELITMQCGPVRVEMEQHVAVKRQLLVHTTDFTTMEAGLDGASIQAMYGELAADEARNRLIASDVAAACAEGRRCLVLTSRVDHVDELGELLSQSRTPVMKLSGRVRKPERAAVLKAASTDPLEPLVLVAIDKVAGEGLDLSGMDTLFLAVPISFKGRIVQQLGRVGRTDASGARPVQVHDYHDSLVPLFDRMFRKRLRVVRRLGWG